MRVILVASPIVADILQTLVASGVEVNTMGSAIDSTNITQIVVLGAKNMFRQEWLPTIAQSLEGRLAQGATMSVILI